MNKKRLICFVILTSLWTGFIFSMSLKPADASSEISKGTLNALLNIFSPVIESVLGELTDEKIDFSHNLLRKAAHFTEFFILGSIALCFTNELKIKLSRFKHIWLFALLYGIVIAVTDETIQLFVAGRAGRIFDVMIDTSGVVAAIIVLKIIFAFLKIQKKKCLFIMTT